MSTTLPASVVRLRNMRGVHAVATRPCGTATQQLTGSAPEPALSSVCAHLSHSSRSCTPPQALYIHPR